MSMRPHEQQRLACSFVLRPFCTCFCFCVCVTAPFSSSSPGKVRGDANESGVQMSDDDAQSSFAMEAVNTKNADGEEMTPEEKQDQLVELLAEKRSQNKHSHTRSHQHREYMSLR